MDRIPPPPVQPLRVRQGRVEIIDQTLLPGEERWIELATVEDVWEAIRALRIRGAPAIGIAAGYGMALVANASGAAERAAFLADMAAARDYLTTARPTAVNLAWAARRVYRVLEESGLESVAELRALAWDEARRIFDEDVDTCRRIGLAGAELLHGNVLTHCNTGGLATGGYGTALAAIYMAHALGSPIHVYVDETRPLLQGARLTTWELAKAGIEATLIADGAAATVLSRGNVSAVIVGADRVAANGDVANKIGTLGVAVLAKHFGVPFYVAMPVSTIDFDTPDGGSIPIEERDPAEVTSFNGVPSSPPGTRAYNPAFDVTPAELVSAFVTEHGVIRPPYTENLVRLSGL